ncbi:hypothetical protein V6N13_105094 [Hibiscus sabdariffa]|uniref:Uncharacterized protein n=2 Tax=Hibiscus sabdariffa TaxID=183260 RepID=A0ABR1ZZH8_9ROSI
MRDARRKTRGGIPNSSPSNVMGSRSSVEGSSFKSPGLNQNPNMHGSHILCGTSYGGTRTSINDDMGRSVMLLDELNHARMSPTGAQPPTGNKNASYDPRPPFMTDRRPSPPP